jgi:hypothetical protein
MHRTRQDSKEIITEGEYTDNGLVSATPSGEPLLKRLALPKIRLHDLPHAAALWFEAGLHLTLVQALLGDASMTIPASTKIPGSTL